MATTMVPTGTVGLRIARDTTARVVEHILATSRSRELTDDIGRGAVADITEICVGLAADVLHSAGEPSPSELQRLRRSAARWARAGVALPAVQHAFHEGFSVGLRMVADSAGDGDYPALVDGAVLLFGLLDAVSEAVSSAYLDEYKTAAARGHDETRAITTALLAGDGRAAGIAERIGVELAAGYEVVALHFPTDENDSTGDRDAAAQRKLARIETALSLYCSPVEPLAMLSATGGTILIPGASATAAEELVARLAEAAGVPVFAAASMSAPERIPDAADNVYELLRLVQRLNYRPGVYRIADLALEFQIARPGVGRRHLSRLLDPLRRIPDLLPTLEAFVSTEANRKKAATQLVVHPNTIDYRLKRIQQITGIDPMKSSGLRALHAALIADSLDPKK